LPNGGTLKQRAEILSTIIAEQAKLVRKLDPNPDLEMMTTLYGEEGMYYDQAGSTYLLTLQRVFQITQG